jgi:hypothetical protein
LSLITSGNEVAGEITKAAPPVSVAGLSLAGIHLQDWVFILTIIYTLLQMGYFIYSKFIKGVKDGSE